MVIRVDQVQVLMDVKCPACGSSLITDKDKAKEIWSRFSKALATPDRQLVDAKKFVKGVTCKNCISNPVTKISATSSYTPAVDEEED